MGVKKFLKIECNKRIMGIRINNSLLIKTKKRKDFKKIIRMVLEDKDFLLINKQRKRTKPKKAVLQNKMIL